MVQSFEPVPMAMFSFAAAPCHKVLACYSVTAWMGGGIHCGLVVTMPGSHTWVRRFDSLLGPHKSRLSQLLYKCGALWNTVYSPSATERPLGAIRKGKGISCGFWVSISSQNDLSCWKRRKTTNNLPSFSWIVRLITQSGVVTDCYM